MLERSLNPKRGKIYVYVLSRVQDMLERSLKPKRGKMSKPWKKDRHEKLRDELENLLAREKIQVSEGEGYGEKRRWFR